MCKNIRIRRAESSDSKKMWQVRTKAIENIPGQHYSEDLIKKWSNAPVPEDYEAAIAHQDWYVATLENKIVGTGFLDMSQGKIAALFVDPDYQGRGIGARILSVLEGIVSECGVDHIDIDATLNAAPFYEANGYEIIEKGCYQHAEGHRLPCYRMRKIL